MKPEREEEIWKDIKGFETKYQVSSLARIKALARFDYGAKNKSLRHYPDRILKPGIDSQGYLLVVLVKNGINKSKRLHRIVAETFVPNPKKYRCVNHKNGIKTDCLPQNLEWCTSSHNNFHAYQIGLKPKTRILTLSKAEEIRASSLSSDDLSKLYGVSKTQINKIKKLTSWKND